MEKQFYDRYLRKVKSLEQRLKKLLDSNRSKPKRNLAKDWQCLLGHVEEYEEEDWKNASFSIFVHFGLIRMHPTSKLHEITNLKCTMHFCAQAWQDSFCLLDMLILGLSILWAVILFSTSSQMVNFGFILVIDLFLILS